MTDTLHYVHAMITIRRALPFAAALTLVVASCGGSSDGDDDASDTASTTAETVADDAEETEDFTESETSEAEPVEEEAAPDTEEPVASEPAETTAEEPADEAPAETTAPDDSETDVGDAATAGVDVALSEWAISAPAEYSAGEVTFNASNGGNFPHELVVIAGEGYEALPLAEGGAVIEDDLPTGALLGRTGRLGGGATEALTVTLAPGNYVLVCNLGGGNNSHAGQGQRLDITVT